MSRFRNFDAAIAELDPIEFEIAGKRYNLGVDPSCDRILAMLAEGRVTSSFRPVDGAATIELLDALMGKENLNQARADGMGISSLSALLDWLVDEIIFAGAATEAVEIAKLQASATSLAVLRGADDPAVEGLVAAIAAITPKDEDGDSGNG